MNSRPDINKLKKIYQNSYIYGKLLEEAKIQLDEELNISALPIMKKSVLVGEQSACIMPEYYREYISGSLIKVRTSGSTGQYLEIYWDRLSYVKSMVQLWMLRAKFYKIYPHNKLCFFFTEMADNNKYIQRKNELGVCKTLMRESSMNEVYTSILQFNPEWMILQPSTAVILCDYIKRNGLKIPEGLRYIEFTGEILSDEVRKMTYDVMKCNIANQYGCNEMNSIAFECPNGNMHILNTNVFVEIIDENGKVISDSSDASVQDSSEGRIIITSRQQKTMPFIRYDIGDRGSIDSDISCDCGCSGKILKLSTGRNNDYIALEDGNYISSYTFVKIFDMINIYTDGAILQFYVEQIEYNEFNVMICKDEEIDADRIINIFYKCLEECLAGARYNFEFSERLFEVRGSGKHMYFKNSLTK